MGKKIITSLYEYVMTQPAPTKPGVDRPVTPTAPPTAPPRPPRPPRPYRPGIDIDREPREDEKERPMAGIMKNIKGSIDQEKGTILAKNLVKKLEKLAALGVTEL